MQNAEISRLIQMVQVQIKRSISKAIIERAKTRVCLHCESRSSKRGLCSKHYEQFRRAGAAQAPRKRIEWECDQIRDGKVLAANLIIRLDSDNVFRSEAQ